MENRSSCIHHLFEQQVSEQPQAIAVIDQNRSLTYQELNQRANQLASYLKSLGVKQEVLIGVCLERSAEMVIALLAILKAGGGYVPFDPCYPQERLNFTIHDAGIFCLLTQKSLQGLFPKISVPLICLDQEQEAITQFPTDNLPSIATSENLAYIIYTSGSTGKPKGVAIEHRSTVAFINWAQSFYPQSTLAGVLASTSICFDLSIFELFVTLSCGGKAILADNALQLPHLPFANAVTLINTVPSAIATLLKIKGIPTSVLTINLAGEALSAKLVHGLYQLEHIQQVFNLYGPSEDTTYSTVALISKDFTGIPPIGKAIAETEIYLLNSDYQPVPQGTEGEIYIAGAGLAREYLHRPELTEAKFIPNPFADQFGTRLYKTGDLGVLLPDGNYQFLGRIDHQVKLRGFRIELGEIEAVLEENSDINQAIVSVQSLSQESVSQEFVIEEQQLIAHIIPNEPSSKISLQHIKNFLKEKLPHYMIPYYFMVMEQFPLTPTGKIDRNALPLPNWQKTALDTYIPPNTSLESQLVKIWQHFLKTEKIGIADSFFDLGGDSLLVAQMLYRLLKVFGIEVSFAYFLEQPTIANLATAIASFNHNNNQNNHFLSSHSTLDYPDDAILPSDINPQSSFDLISLQDLPQAILLTGVTGILGVHLLHELLQQTSAQIYCLVRAKTVEVGLSRIETHLRQQCLYQEQWQDRIIPVLGDLAEPRLGLSSQEYEYLTKRIDQIYHCGAWVNIVYPYTLLRETNVKGTLEVLRLACLDRIKPVHFVSTVDVFPSTGIRKITEQDAIRQVHLCSGYAESKAIAEKLVMAAYNRSLPISIYRPSNIIGTVASGLISNGFIAKMLESCIQMGTAPNLEACVNLVPVNYVSQAIVTLSQVKGSTGKAFHLVNTQPISWIELVQWLNQRGYPLQLVSHQTWYRQLDQLISQNVGISLSPLILPLAHPNFVQRSLGAFHFTKNQTSSDLDELGISCPSVHDLLQNIFKPMNLPTNLRSPNPISIH
ncbi:amino acid adenylation enzyme/thioester reductase family protein [Synechococcus sp. PCC 7502]|uniref:amino acid adenylation domain-containing protein n=1 Tax=Synechococcus sp. PCC 7502 TaxID=1173263 RepID=UPI00029FE4C7|nr:amino acid adenylation domain-containing protein [Synechococcus sp. PCC 7502]AFY75009.1 amino acid adenylation enzyme/thioester reductase family protein [Synechococcus sp. PCC 7502]